MLPHLCFRSCNFNNSILAHLEVLTTVSCQACNERLIQSSQRPGPLSGTKDDAAAHMAREQRPKLCQEVRDFHGNSSCKHQTTFLGICTRIEQTTRESKNQVVSSSCAPFIFNSVTHFWDCFRFCYLFCVVSQFHVA